MSDKHDLIPVIDVDPEKCVNCHACITACPVKYCNDGSGDYVKVNSNMCIGCGSCLPACTHEARYAIDDLDTFIHDIKNGVPMVAITAPSIAANFPEHYQHINGWLKSLGISAIFDVSFGAELTVKSYIEFIRQKNPTFIIAQPCPAIVSFVEIYHPELCQYLAPVDSPMVHTMKMIERFYPRFKKHKVVVLSPCLAKKREFVATGYGDYNVGYISLKKYFENEKITIENYDMVEFDNPSAERAVLFSSPGGLMRTAERWNPSIRERTRKIEGIHSIYDYLERVKEHISEGKTPLLVDCLSCSLGCNGGPLTLVQSLPQDEIEYRIEKRKQELKERYLKESAGNEIITRESIENTLDQYWEETLYKRIYQNLHANEGIKMPNNKEREIIYHLMHKYSNKDIYNCTSCGYFSCESMATAIFNNVNRPENCHFYLAKEKDLSNERIEEREHLFRNILETSLEGFVQVDNEFVIQKVNKAMCYLLGREEHELIGYPVAQFANDKGKAIFAKQYEIRQRGERSAYEITFINKDGSEVMTVINASPLYDKDNVRIGSFGMVSDITSLRTMHEQLEKRVESRTHDLKHALHTTRRILDAMPFGIIIISRHKIIRSINDAALKLIGARREEIVGRECHSLLCEPDSDNCPIIDREKMIDTSEVEIKSKDGKIIPVLKTVLPIKLENEEVLLETFFDITDRKHAEAAMRKAKEVAEIASQAKSQFLANMSHEIRTPINAVIGFSGLLNDTELDTVQKDFVNTIIASGEMLLGIVNNILDLSKIEADEIVLEHISFDLLDIVEDVVRITSTHIDPIMVTIEFTIQESMPMRFMGDPTRIRQILLNVLGNAVKFTKKGKISVDIREDLLQGDITTNEIRTVCITISDTGVGITKEKLHTIFEPFAQEDTSTTRKYGGTGLGLSISKKFVEMMGGTISVTSELNKGSTFVIVLPLHEYNMSTEEKPIRKTRMQNADVDLANAHILVVEDNEVNQKLVEVVLRKFGCRVSLATNGQEAVESLKRDVFDAVLMDLQMPVMGGCEAATIIRQEMKLDVPIIALTAAAMKTDEQRVFMCGMNDYLTKPFSADDLKAILCEWIHS